MHTLQYTLDLTLTIILYIVLTYEVIVITWFSTIFVSP